MKKEKKSNEEKIEEEKVENSEQSKEVKPEEKTVEQLLALAKLDAEMWKNKFYQNYADLDNTRKQLEKEHLTMVKYRAMGFVEKLLPVLDSFQMAFKIEPTNPEIINYSQGYKMILSQFLKAMEEEGVVVVAPKNGDKFDATNMQAISTVEGEKDDLIANVYLNGYLLKDRIVRPAMVIVSKKKEVEVKKNDSQESAGQQVEE